MGARPAAVAAGPMIASADRRTPPSGPWAGSVHGRQALLGAVAAGLAACSITPLAALAATLPPLLVLVGEASGRRPLTLVGVVVSVLYVGQSPGGVPAALLVAAGAGVGTLVRVVGGGMTAWVHRAVPPALLLAMVLIDQLVRPVLTTVGEYSVFEQVVVLTCLVALLVDGRRPELDVPDEADTALHTALVWTALVAGADGLRALSEATPEAIAGRQAAGIFGASNYVAALLAVATLACVHRACTGAGRPAPNVVGAIVFVAMAVPQASRTSTVVVVLVVVWLLLAHRRHVWLLVSLGGVAVLLAVAPSIGVLERFRAGEVVGDELNGRTELWAFALRSIERHPVVGVGSGRTSDALVAAGFGDATYVHDIWLSLVAQFGIAGLVFLVLGTMWIFTAPLGSYARTLAVAGLMLSTAEPVVETMKMGLIFAAVIGAGASHVRRHDTFGLGGRHSHDLGGRRLPFRPPTAGGDRGDPPRPGGRADRGRCEPAGGGDR